MTASISLSDIRYQIRTATLMDEKAAVEHLVVLAGLGDEARARIAGKGAKLVADVRSQTTPGLMEAFLAEYGLSTGEGLALMCLAEALLRVPDTASIDALIEDKIMGRDWGEHAGASISQLVNVSTMGLQVTSAVLDATKAGVVGTLKSAAKRLGMPVIRTAVKQVMVEMGRQFVLGEDMDKATDRAKAMEDNGYLYSYDMLGEAARTAADADVYFAAYASAIRHLAASAKTGVQDSPGISIKLSALHPRYDRVQHQRVMDELVPRVRTLAEMAKNAGLGLNIDAEEADRLDLSLDVIEAVLSSATLEGWDGFGVVVQAYSKRAPYVLDYLYALADHLDRKIMVRLVKGAYWDAEIKRAQVLGLNGFPVFTVKAHSDISYIGCAAKLFQMMDRIYPQFATHNAHSVAAIMQFADTYGVSEGFEFQRLHGMGEQVHSELMKQVSVPCRIYAPVGVHRDLLAYLVRRLLENGANSSFVNQIVDTAIAPEDVAADPFAKIGMQNKAVKLPVDIFGEGRSGSKGFDIRDPLDIDLYNSAKADFKAHEWNMVGGTGEKQKVTNPAKPDDCVGYIQEASIKDVHLAFEQADKAQEAWSKLGVDKRADILLTAANTLENNMPELLALLTREAGKTLADGIAEIREAVDFLRYYASEAVRRDELLVSSRGVFACISPWNFPLAIFIGQVAAALVRGNAVLAKPALQTPLIAARAVGILHAAGVPKDILHLLVGGPEIGAELTRLPKIGGVCFTGSTATAQAINKSLAEHARPGTPLVAETGGLNAMIVDSTALPEQAVRDIVDSAFQSAGQRCSALRVLYVQEDVMDRTLTMLKGAMDELTIGDPWHLSTDIGPVIDSDAKDNITGYCAERLHTGEVVKSLAVPTTGFYAEPTVVKVDGIQDIPREIFGPVLHVAPYRADDLGLVLDDINARGFGLTLGLHTRIDDRAEFVCANAAVGNIYVNRNQIGAVVGSQPFGGEGMSGTGPKAGGPHYLDVFVKGGYEETQSKKYIPQDKVEGADITKAWSNNARINVGLLAKHLPDHAETILSIQARMKTSGFYAAYMPGPVGESNALTLHARGNILIVGNSVDSVLPHVVQGLFFNNAICVVTADKDVYAAMSNIDGLYVLLGEIGCDVVKSLSDLALLCLGDMPDKDRKSFRQAAANRDGALVPVVCDGFAPYRYCVERHVCTDTAASGGDAALLAGGES